MKVRKQFEPIDSGTCVLISTDNAFVPEMSLPIESILAQFSFVDNVRVADMAKRGYDFADSNDDDFDVEEFDRLDLAEKDEVYNHAKKIVDRYNEIQAMKEEVVQSDDVSE